MATYTNGDYKYTYTVVTSGTGYASVEVVNTNKTTYGTILSSFVVNGITYIVEDMSACFYGCTSLTSAPTIPSSVENMDYCFYDCTNLTFVPTIPNSVQTLSSCFYNCTSLASIPNFPDALIYMDYCFYGCTSLTSVPIIPNSVYNMEYCFYNCTSLTSIPNLPAPSDDVLNAKFCFCGCRSLTHASIPNIKMSLGIQVRGMFENCTSLQYLYAGASPSDGRDFLKNATQPIRFVIIGNSDSTVRYLKSYWEDNIIELFPNLVFDSVMAGDIFSCDDYQCTILSVSGSRTDISIKAINKTKTYYQLFYDDCIYTSFNNIHFENVNMNDCFANCINLKTVSYMPSKVTNMNNCFSGCSSLQTAPYISNYVTSMSNCFANCNSLTSSPTIPNLVTNMSGCFQGCTNLQTAPVIPSSVTNMSNCFLNCTSLIGNIVIKTALNSSSSNGANIFNGTIQPIYIINDCNDSSAITIWRAIAADYVNVHYEADDKSGPIISATCSRVNSEKEIDTFGTYANIIITSTPNDTNLPISTGLPAGKTFAPSIIQNTELYIDDDISSKITIDNTGLTSIDYNYNLSQSVAPSEILNRHILNVIVTDNYEKTTTYSVILPRAAAILDFLGYPPKDSFYLDNPGTGMAIGKFATRSGLDIEYPTSIGQELLPAYNKQYTPAKSVGPYNSTTNYYRYDDNLNTYYLVENNLINETDYNNNIYFVEQRIIDLYNPQLIVGQYNEMNPEATFIIGNGTSNSNRSNALEIYNNGSVSFDRNAGRGILAAIVDLIYPIGCYFETSNPNFDPNIEFGGEWVEETPGLVHVSAGTGYPVVHANDNDGAGARDGGSAYIQQHSHAYTAPTLNNHAAAACTRTTNVSMNAHNHRAVKYASGKLGSGTLGARIYGASNTTAGLENMNTTETTVSVATQPTFNTPVLTHSYSNTGSVGNINTSGLNTGTAGNMQPYIVVYRWHRYA